MITNKIGGRLLVRYLSFFFMRATHNETENHFRVINIA